MIDPTNEAGKKSSDFLGNPYEDEEREERLREYEELFDEELKETVGQNILLREVFTPRITDSSNDTELPSQLRKGQWSLRFNPKFDDFTDKNSVRLPVGFRYSVSERFILNFDAEPFIKNPLGERGKDITLRGEEPTSGLTKVRIGGKYSWVNAGGSDWNIAVGGFADLPTGDAPLEFSDSYARIEPYITVSRQFENFDKWLFYLNTTYRFIEESPFDSRPVDPQARDQLFLRPGAIYYPGGKFRYAIELEYRTNALDSRNASKDFTLPPGFDGSNVPPGYRRENWILAFRTIHEVILKPSVTWFPTKEIREGLYIPGNWDVGIEMDIPIIEETGKDFGISIRFKWYYDYRRLIAKDLPEFFRNSTNRLLN